MIELIPTIIIGLILLIWFLVSAVCQYQNQITAKLRSFDVFSLIPCWTFFAPNPGTSDYHLLYRDRYEDGAFTSFKEVSLISRISIVGAIWNPEKRNQKILSDAVRSLAMLVSDLNINEIQVTIPYLLILNHITNLERSDNVDVTQFVIAISYGYISLNEPKIFMASKLHSI